MKQILAALLLALVLLSGCDTKAPEPTPETAEERLADGGVILRDVESSALSRVGYDKREHVLVAEFKDSGAIYAYYDVPESVYNALLDADSIGSYFYYNVRTSYAYERLN